MPTEITTEMRHVVSHVAEKSRVQQQNGVIDKAVARQVLPGNGQNVPPAKESNQSDQQQLGKVASEMNHYVQNLKRDLHFSVDAESGETIIKVVDSENQRLIRTIPSDEFLSMSQRFTQSVGMLLNAKV